jgi:malate dehydrogenase (oxaloacetate-decarboxylating)(NADP+)
MSSISIFDEEVFQFHKNGKIRLALAKKLLSQKDLSLAYTPGVAKVCKAIAKDYDLTWEYTSKQNAVAVVTDGTALLGLGNIGVHASIPVMEGKAVLFKAFADIDAWPVPLDHVLNPDRTSNVEKIITITKSIACMYGGINLEDIAAPYCFEIEDRLDKELDIPVFHDDQWGTAIITLAAVENYLLIANKKIEKVTVVINGAGAAGIRIADMLKAAGIQSLYMCDRKGIIHEERSDLNIHKKKHALKTNKRTLKEAMKGADIFIGVSAADVVDEEMVLSMNHYPAIFAMANPDPEIHPQKVKNCMNNRPYIMATGRSDFANQINNVLGFPYIFRGALDVRATTITMNMKIQAAKALASLTRETEVPSIVSEIYGRQFIFGPDYLIPTPFDPRIKQHVSKAVSDAAIKDNVIKQSTVCC